MQFLRQGRGRAGEGIVTVMEGVSLMGVTGGYDTSSSEYIDYHYRSGKT